MSSKKAAKKRKKKEGQGAAARLHEAAARGDCGAMDRLTNSQSDLGSRVSADSGKT